MTLAWACELKSKPGNESISLSPLRLFESWIDQPTANCYRLMRVDSTSLKPETIVQIGKLNEKHEWQNKLISYFWKPDSNLAWLVGYLYSNNYAIFLVIALQLNTDGFEYSVDFSSTVHCTSGPMSLNTSDTDAAKYNKVQILSCILYALLSVPIFASYDLLCQGQRETNINQTTGLIRNDFADKK